MEERGMMDVILGHGRDTEIRVVLVNREQNMMLTSSVSRRWHVRSMALYQLVRSAWMLFLSSIMFVLVFFLFLRSLSVLSRQFNLHHLDQQWLQDNWY